MSTFSLQNLYIIIQCKIQHTQLHEKLLFLVRTEWQVGIVKAQAQNWARELADTPANLMTPTIFAQRVSEILTHLGVNVQVRDKAWAEQKKMGSFLSVSRGSDEQPKFIEISYKGAEDADAPPMTFVGKGVTFDAGGVSLKVSHYYR